MQLGGSLPKHPKSCHHHVALDTIAALALDLSPIPGMLHTYLSYSTFQSPNAESRVGVALSSPEVAPRDAGNMCLTLATSVLASSVYVPAKLICRKSLIIARILRSEATELLVSF